MCDGWRIGNAGLSKRVGVFPVKGFKRMTTTKAQRSLGGRPSHAPTARTRRSVIDLVAAGFSQDRIAGEVGIDAKTLRLHYREELGFGEAITEARLAQNVMRLTKCRNSP